MSIPQTTTTKTTMQNSDGSQTVTEETIYPDGRITKAVTTTAANAATGVQPPYKGTHPNGAGDGVPMGAWRHELFSCFDICGNGMFWMAWCCTYIAIGQLLQRLKMNICGQPGGDYKNT